MQKSQNFNDLKRAPLPIRSGSAGPYRPAAPTPGQVREIGRMPDRKLRATYGPRNHAPARKKRIARIEAGRRFACALPDIEVLWRETEARGEKSTQ